MGIQLSVTAVNEKCVPIAGNATLLADSIMGVLKAFNATITSTAACVGCKVVALKIPVHPSFYGPDDSISPSKL